MKLRDCQRLAAAATREALLSTAGPIAGAIRMPTRSGKLLACIASLHQLAQRGALPERVGFATSRTLLVDDAYQAAFRVLDPRARDFSADELDRDIKLVRTARRTSKVVGRWDGHATHRAQVTFTTYPSLADLGPLDLLMCDEAHRTRGCRPLIESYPRRIGWTATPHGAQDSDRLPFDRLLYELTYADAVAQGVIVPWVPREYTGALLRGDDGLFDPSRLLPVALDMLAEDGGPEAIGPVLFTAPDLATAGWIAERIRERGWTAEAVVPRRGAEGMTRKGLRGLLRRFEAGEVQCLVTVDWLAEGVTIPSLRALVLTCAPRGRTHLCQICGRVMGTCAPDRWGAKTQAVIYDPGLILRVFKLEYPARLGEVISGRPKALRRVVRETMAEIKALPYAQSVTPLEAWSGALLRAVEASPGLRRELGVVRTPLGLGARACLASAAQWKELRQLEPLSRWLAGPVGRRGESAVEERDRLRVGEAHREALRALVEGGVAPAGVVWDLCTALRLVAYHSRVAAGGTAGWQQGRRYVRVPVGVALPTVVIDVQQK